MELRGKRYVRLTGHIPPYHLCIRQGMTHERGKTGRGSALLEGRDSIFGRWTCSWWSAASSFEPVQERRSVQ